MRDFAEWLVIGLLLAAAVLVVLGMAHVLF